MQESKGSDQASIQWRDSNDFWQRVWPSGYFFESSAERASGNAFGWRNLDTISPQRRKRAGADLGQRPRNSPGFTDAHFRSVLYHETKRHRSGIDGGETKAC